jgi:tetratricopeptide (TPR) repeat protein
MYTAEGQYDQALQIIQTIDEPFMKTEALINLASVCEEKGKTLDLLYQAFQVAQTIEDIVQKANNLTAIADKYIEIGQNDKALEILSQSLQIAQTIEKTTLKVHALTNISGKYVKAGQNDKALEILSQSFQIVKATEGKVDKIFTLWNISNIYAVVGQYDQSLQVVQAMENCGIKVDLLTSMADKYIEAGQKDKASDILFQSLQSICAIKDTTERWMKLDKITNMYTKDGIEINERAKNLIDEIKRELK